MPSRTLNLDDDVYQYVLDHTVREHPVAAELRAATASMKHGGMQIGPDQGQFMQLLVKMLGARRTIEIGVFTGYSSLAVALALPEDGKIVACDVNEEWTAMARRYWEKAGVRLRVHRCGQERLSRLLRALPRAAAQGRPHRDRQHVVVGRGGEGR
jgi:predicted O-methyltransferase YrrM